MDEADCSANAANAAAEVTVQRLRRVSFPQEICFHEAVRAGDMRELRRVLQEGGFDINSLSHCGVTALHQSALDGRLGVVTSLIEAGANLYSVCRDGWLPLHAAAAMGHTHVVELFLSYGVDPMSRTPLGETPRDLLEEDDEVTRQVLLQAERNARSRPSSAGERKPLFRCRGASSDSGLVLCDDEGEEEDRRRISTVSGTSVRSGRTSRIGMVRGSRVSQSSRPVSLINMDTEEVFL